MKEEPHNFVVGKPACIQPAWLFIAFHLFLCHRCDTIMNIWFDKFIEFPWKQTVVLGKMDTCHCGPFMQLKYFKIEYNFVCVCFEKCLRLWQNGRIFLFTSETVWSRKRFMSVCMSSQSINFGGNYCFVRQILALFEHAIIHRNAILNVRKWAGHLVHGIYYQPKADGFVSKSVLQWRNEKWK